MTLRKPSAHHHPSSPTTHTTTTPPAAAATAHHIHQRRRPITVRSRRDHGPINKAPWPQAMAGAILYTAILDRSRAEGEAQASPRLIARDGQAMAPAHHM